MRVVAEHGRAMTFLIADGAIPGNEGRGYVLRRLIRRALYHADQLGLEAPILPSVAQQVRDAMGSGYPEVVEQQALVDQVLNQEENRFRDTLATGRLLLEQQTIPLKRSFAEVTDEFIAIMPADIVSAAWLGELEWAVDDVPIRNRTIGDITINEVQDLARQALKGTMPTDQALAAARAATARISGEEAFVLYDTYGIPRELTQAVAEAAGLTLDIEGFEAALADQQERARQAAKFDSDEEAAAFAELDLASTFSGYHEITAGSQIAAIVRDGEPVAHASTGDQVSVVLDTTPFYAEGGGQVGDAGAITANGAQLEISETRAFGDVIAHIGKVTAGQFTVGDQVEAHVDRSRRADTTRNHTATHLLHAALRNVLGEHVRQAGSLVAPDHLRFDYTQSEAPTPEQLADVQRLVRSRIRENLPVETLELPYAQALQRGAMAIFGEKYATEVRVVEICDPAPHVHDCFSKELCGGTHAPATGFVGGFQITSEGSVGAGVRRIEALTGAAAEAWVEQRLNTLNDLAGSLRATPATLPDRVSQMRDELQTLRRRLADVEAQTGASVAEQLAANPTEIDGVAVVAGRVDVDSAAALRSAGDEVRRRLDEAVIVLGAVANDRPLFIAMITPGLVARGLHAGQLIGGIARIAGGGGGGKPEMAQAGGRDATRLDAALAATADAVRAQLADG